MLYAEKNISGDDGSHNLSNIDIDSRDGDYHDCGDVDADDDVSKSCVTEAGGKGIGGNLKERATAARLFRYSDNNYDHLYDKDIDKDEKRIENTTVTRGSRYDVGKLISSQVDPPRPTTTG